MSYCIINFVKIVLKTFALQIEVIQVTINMVLQVSTTVMHAQCYSGTVTNISVEVCSFCIS